MFHAGQVHAQTLVFSATSPHVGWRHGVAYNTRAPYRCVNLCGVHNPVCLSGVWHVSGCLHCSRRLRHSAHNNSTLALTASGLMEAASSRWTAVLGVAVVVVCESGKPVNSLSAVCFRRLEKSHAAGVRQSVGGVSFWVYIHAWGGLFLWGIKGVDNGCCAATHSQIVGIWAPAPGGLWQTAGQPCLKKHMPWLKKCAGQQ